MLSHLLKRCPDTKVSQHGWAFFPSVRHRSLNIRVRKLLIKIWIKNYQGTAYCEIEVKEVLLIDLQNYHFKLKMQ